MRTTASSVIAVAGHSLDRSPAFGHCVVSTAYESERWGVDIDLSSPRVVRAHTLRAPVLTRQAR